MAEYRYDLKAIYKERLSDPMFQTRDTEYQKWHKYYNGETDPGMPRWWSLGEGGKSTMRDEGPQQRQAHLVISWASQVVNHFTSQFGRLPHVRKLPASAEDGSLEFADKETALIQSVFNRSRLQAKQMLQAHRFSLDGDAVYGVEWDSAKGQVYVRGWDPGECYPDFDDMDYGGLRDILIKQSVTAQWVWKTFGIQPAPGKAMLDYFVYWDKTERIVQVEDTRLESLSFVHDLGFVPFRWAFSRPTGGTGTSDIKDIVLMQDAYNEIVVLMFHALRRNIEKAYWGKGLRGDLTPIPGKVINIGTPDAEINEFPSAEPPQTAINVLGTLAQDIGRVAGISPISLEGVAQGSIMTGSAVRHQVQAIESRSETKKIMLEATFAAMGEQILQIVEQKFPNVPIAYRTADKGIGRLSGGDIKGDYECRATYGQLLGIDITQRIQVALQALGKLVDDRKAIELMDLEDVTASDMVKRVESYQIRMAGITGRAQAIGQEAAQSVSGQAGGPQVPQGVQGPQTPERPQAPSPDAFMQKLGKLQDVMHLVSSRMKGHAWAVGEIAISGVSSDPTVMVEKAADQGIVAGLVSQFGGQVVVGHPDGLPSVQLV